MGCMIVYCFNERESAKMVCLRVWRRRLRGGVRVRRNTNGVLNQPFIDSFCGMCHKHSAPEVCLREHVGEGGGVIDMKTVVMSVFVQYTIISAQNASGKLYIGSQGTQDRWDNILY